MRRPANLALALLAATAVSVACAPAAGAAFGPVGALSQLPGQAGCIHDAAAEDCADGRFLAPAQLAFSRTGGSLLAPAALQSALAVLSVDPATGALTQPAAASRCLVADSGVPAPPNCALAINLHQPNDIAVAPTGGEHVYVAVGNGVAALQSDGAGGFTGLPGAAGCMSDDDHSQPGNLDNRCVNGRELASTRGIAISPDGGNVYVTSNGGIDRYGVAVLTRDPASGALTQSTAAGGCISSGSEASGDADLPPGNLEMGCDGPVRAMSIPTDVVVARDGATVYVSTFDGVVVLRRLPDGRLQQLAGTAGCVVSDSGLASSATCADGRALPLPSQLALSPDGRSLYVANAGNEAVAHFAVAADGTLSQATDATGCASGPGTVPDGPGACAPARSLANGGAAIAVSPDGTTVAVAGNPGIGEVALLDRGPNGALSQAADTRGCVSSTGAASGTGGGPVKCAQGRGLGGSGVAFSAGGERFYAAGPQSVAFFRREVAPRCTDASASTSSLTTISVAFACSDLNGDPVSLTVAGAPANGSTGAPAGLAVPYTPAKTFGGTDSFSVVPSDGVNAGPPATATIAVTKARAAPLPRLRTKTLRVRRGRVTLRLACPRSAPAACTGRITIRTAAKVKISARKRVKVLAKRFNVRPGKGARLRAKVSRAALRALRFKRRIKVVATLSAPQRGEFAAASARRRLTLRR